MSTKKTLELVREALIDLDLHPSDGQFYYDQYREKAEVYLQKIAVLLREQMIEEVTEEVTEEGTKEGVELKEDKTHTTPYTLHPEYVWYAWRRLFFYLDCLRDEDMIEQNTYNSMSDALTTLKQTLPDGEELG